MEIRSSRSRFGDPAAAVVDEAAAGGGGGGGGGEGERVECTCRSCTAIAVADCVALGCCPCAVVSMLTLALVKVPWAVSRRCLRMVRGSSFCRRRRRRRRVRASEEEKRTTRAAKSPSETATTKKGGAGEGGDELLGGVLGMRGGEISDKVWIEFYQIGQWGFGRLSFSGIKAWDWGS